VGHGDVQPGLLGEASQLGLPRPESCPVGAAAIRGDQQPFRLRVGIGTDVAPPPADRLDREGRGVVMLPTLGFPLGPDTLTPDRGLGERCPVPRPSEYPEEFRWDAVVGPIFTGSVAA